MLIKSLIFCNISNGSVGSTRFLNLGKVSVSWGALTWSTTKPQFDVTQKVGTIKLDANF